MFGTTKEVTVLDIGPTGLRPFFGLSFIQPTDVDIVFVDWLKIKACRLSKNTKKKEPRAANVREKQKKVLKISIQSTRNNGHKHVTEKLLNKCYNFL